MGRVFKLWLDLVKLLTEELPGYPIMPEEIPHDGKYVASISLQTTLNEIYFYITCEDILDTSVLPVVVVQWNNGKQFKCTSNELDMLRACIRSWMFPPLTGGKLDTIFFQVSDFLSIVHKNVNITKFELSPYDGSLYDEYFVRKGASEIVNISELTGFSYIGMVLMFEATFYDFKSKSDVIVPGYFGICFNYANSGKPLDGVFFNFGVEPHRCINFEIDTDDYDERISDFEDAYSVLVKRVINYTSAFLG